MDRLERLVNLVVALLDTSQPLTREQLRQRVGGYSDDEDNFHRNFERDKDLLRQMGIPLVAEPLDRGVPEAGTGYRIPRQLYELPDPGFDEDELMALGLAASKVAFEGAGQGAATTALWKLAGTGAGTGAGRAGAAGAQGRGNPGRVRPSAVPLVDVVVDERVAGLFSGVAERRVVRFGYNGVARRVDPYRLSYRQGRWYLAGFDHGRQAERLFRTDRISDAVELEELAGAFTRPEGPPPGPPPPWRLGDDEEVVVDLWVDADQAPWVRALAGEEAVASTSPEGGTYFKVGVTNRSAFRSFVLGLLEHAEVISPPEVRDELIGWLTSVAGTDAGQTGLGPTGPTQEGPGRAGPSRVP